MFDLSKMQSLVLLPTKEGWADARAQVSVRIIDGIPAFTTSRVTDYTMYWDKRTGYRHWSCEISYGGDDQYMVFIKSLTPGKPARMYWKNSY